MRALFLPFAGLGVLASVSAAEAASPAYCALYAREYANQFSQAIGGREGSEQRIQDEAYYRCLNLDEDPELPQTSAYFGTDIDPGGQGGPLEPLPGEKAATGGTIPADAAGSGAPEAAAAPEATPPAGKQAQAAARRGYTSGAAPWTPEWRAWCKKKFPNSFDEQTGTILPFGGKRQMCQ